jgi:hypothetical protein
MTIALKLITQVDAGYYFPGVIAFGNNNAQVLVFVAVAFVCVCWTRMAFGITLSLIDVVFNQHLFYFGFVNVAALHAAAGVFGVN